jgi:hypothetical protein
MEEHPKSFVDLCDEVLDKQKSNDDFNTMLTEHGIEVMKNMLSYAGYKRTEEIVTFATNMLNNVHTWSFKLNVNTFQVQIFRDNVLYSGRAPPEPSDLSMQEKMMECVKYVIEITNEIIADNKLDMQEMQNVFREAGKILFELAEF